MEADEAQTNLHVGLFFFADIVYSIQWFCVQGYNVPDQIAWMHNLI